MKPALDHGQHRKAQRRAGKPVLRFNAAPPSAARKDAQDGASPVTVTPLLTGGGGSKRSRLFSNSRCSWCLPLSAIEPQRHPKGLRRGRADLLNSQGWPAFQSIASHSGLHRRNVRPQHGRSAVQICAALLIGRSHQLYRISDKPGSDLAYPLHRRTPFVSSGCYVPRDSDGAITRVQKAFAFGATEHE